MGPASSAECRRRWISRPVAGLSCTVQWAVGLDRRLLSVLVIHREVQVPWCKWTACLPATCNYLSFTADTENSISSEATSTDLPEEGLALHSAPKCRNIGNLDSAPPLRIPWATQVQSGFAWRTAEGRCARPRLVTFCPASLKGCRGIRLEDSGQECNKQIASTSLLLSNRFHTAVRSLPWIWTSMDCLDDQQQLESRLLFGQRMGYDISLMQTWRNT